MTSEKQWIQFLRVPTSWDLTKAPCRLHALSFMMRRHHLIVGRSHKNTAEPVLFSRLDRLSVSKGSCRRKHESIVAWRYIRAGTNSSRCVELRAARGLWAGKHSSRVLIGFQWVWKRLIRASRSRPGPKPGTEEFVWSLLTQALLHSQPRGCAWEMVLDGTIMAKNTMPTINVIAFCQYACKLLCNWLKYYITWLASYCIIVFNRLKVATFLMLLALITLSAVAPVGIIKSVVSTLYG